MSTTDTNRFKIVLSCGALLLIVLTAFSFTKSSQPEALLSQQLHFKYQAPGGSFEDQDVENPSNWLRVDEEEACTTLNDVVACSFTIEVPEVETTSYYNSTTMQGTARLLIEVAGTTEAYVTDVKDNSQITPPSIQSAINNQPEP